MWKSRKILSVFRVSAEYMCRQTVVIRHAHATYQLFGALKMLLFSFSDFFLHSTAYHIHIIASHQIAL